jgi:glycosyltransferase involved in cell wall biosynthesis
MIDVIFPFHRNDRFLTEALDSLYASKSVDIRLVVVDDRIDKEKDLTKLFVKFENFEYVNSTGGCGYGHCLMLASNYLTSEFTALMNSDDTVHPERFARQIKMLDYSELSISKMNRIDGDGRVKKSILGDILGSKYNPAFLILGAYGANATWCMQRDWWVKNAIFDNEQCLDWRIALRSFQDTQITYSKIPLYNYRKHSGQVTSHRNIPQIELDSLYNSWSDYISVLIAEEIPREIFNLLAVPWNAFPSKVDQSYFMHRNLILLKIKECYPEIYNDFLKLVMRRDISAITRSGSFLTKIKLIMKSYKELVPLGKDLLTYSIK